MVEYCARHEGVEASGRCHSCGKLFCGDCLTEGNERRYCPGAECQACMVRDEAVRAEGNGRVEAALEEMDLAIDKKVMAFQVILWILTAPLFVYLGSDGWTANFAVASAMGPLGALVLALQMRPVIGIFKRRYLERRRTELS
ncbi:MAG: B-box zinc finger protein [Syntrophobacteraceae bacterium]|nr:B-box zinc finger protein [Syntrophobacteraceae bacterium]